MFIHYKSAIPKQAKYNVIQNSKERNLIDQRCCAQSAKHKHQLDFTHTLLLNEYSAHWIQDTQLQPRTTRSRQPDDNIDWLYLSTPYVSDAVDHKIRNIFKHEGLRVRIAHKSTTLRQTLQKKNETPICNRQNRIIICFNKNVAYKITCNKCHLFYIGSTIRQNLHDKIHEHLTKPTSSAFEHLAACNNSTDNSTNVLIIGRDAEPGNLRMRLKEAFHIDKVKPQINSREECNELKDLLF